jgi:hypothetical protein
MAFALDSQDMTFPHENEWNHAVDGQGTRALPFTQAKKQVLRETPIAFIRLA